MLRLTLEGLFLALCATLLAVAFCTVPLFPAHAQGVVATTVDVSPLSNFLIPTIGALMLGVATWLSHRVLGLAEKLLGVKADAAAQAVLDDAIQAAIRWAQTKLQADLADKSQIDVKNAVIAEAANFVTAHFSTTLAATGLTPDALAGKIEAALGITIAAPVTSPVPPAAPVTGSAAS